MVPGAARFAILVNPNNPQSELMTANGPCADVTGSSCRAISLRSSETIAPALSSFTSLPKVSRKASDALTSSSNSMPFFGRNEAWRKKLLFEKYRGPRFLSRS